MNFNHFLIFHLFEQFSGNETDSFQSQVFKYERNKDPNSTLEPDKPLLANTEKPIQKNSKISVCRVMNVWLMIHDPWKTDPCEFHQCLFNFYIISVCVTTRNWLNILNLLDTFLDEFFRSRSRPYPGICL